VTALVISVGVELLVTGRWTRQFFSGWFHAYGDFYFTVHAWENCPVFPLEIAAIIRFPRGDCRARFHGWCLLYR